ncbi:MAG: hypothetical protein COT91_02795 [Candidatus Doudnabacteria bacterium CG10_big_fil_rev_8_21_14_0_10_41_10]|uniref:Undecaprenyl-phosphate alpha-N-acetylglucosaminyl 1-phosphate transferase n=1 Tax=Candidatus Doudnabacteria bacterium CG10_big_fil_rev_8_21_14_0_10_41_10 TaxID=1974551 RepID=A0A2H0VFN7_9BACT|nr:MAG: hypothetical protein COT91_02795 [Candidatus Doudnabacteria bacterium CG10_big_fil_rev_8_21_14_0_10_41_10]
MIQEHLLAFFIPFGLVLFVFTPLVRKFAFRTQVLDQPDSPRKVQSAPVPKLGGWAVFLGFASVIAVWQIFWPEFFGLFIKNNYLWGILVGGFILALGGYLDDRFVLAPRYQFLFPVLAVVALIVSGVQLSYINNPFGGAILFDTVKILSYPLFGGIFIFVWVLGMIYTTKFLDGLDGLVSGVAGIGAIVLFLLSQIPQVSQPDTALLSIMFAGAILGFLPWNFHPAKIYLGEGGSTFAGFMIGALAIISGGKVATALLIMGIPILDVAWVILRRTMNQFSPFTGDRKHLHFRLLDIGLSHRQAVMVLYFFSAAFGVSGLFLQSAGKVVALAVLFAVMVLLGGFLVIGYHRKIKN